MRDLFMGGAGPVGNSALESRNALGLSLYHRQSLNNIRIIIIIGEHFFMCHYVFCLFPLRCMYKKSPNLMRPLRTLSLWERHMKQVLNSIGED